MKRETRDLYVRVYNNRVSRTKNFWIPGNGSPVTTNVVLVVVFVPVVVWVIVVIRFSRY